MQQSLRARRGSTAPQDWPRPEFLSLAQTLQSQLLAAGWTESLLRGHEGRRADHLVCP